MIQAKVNTKELQDLLKKLSTVSEGVKRKGEVQIEASARRIEKKAKNRAPSGADGILKASINVRGSKLEREVYSDTKYAPYVEFGTKSKTEIPSELKRYASQFKGGSGGSFADLQKSIKRWAEKKGIPEEAVFPIAMNIAKFGVKAQPFLFPAFFEERPKLIKNLAKVLKGIR